MTSRSAGGVDAASSRSAATSLVLVPCSLWIFKHKWGDWGQRIPPWLSTSVTSSVYCMSSYLLVYSFAMWMHNAYADRMECDSQWVKSAWVNSPNCIWWGTIFGGFSSYSIPLCCSSSTPLVVFPPHVSTVALTDRHCNWRKHYANVLSVQKTLSTFWQHISYLSLQCQCSWSCLSLALIFGWVGPYLFVCWVTLVLL